MLLDEAFTLVPQTLVPADLTLFRSNIDPLWIEQALELMGTATVRKRRLPAEQVIWLVVGMALLRNQSIERVAAMLDLALPSTTGDLVAKSALSQARQRLGSEPMEYLFRVTGHTWAHKSADAHRWRGLGVYGLDGTTLRVPDSESNWEAFGGQASNGDRNGSAYPTVRAVALMTLRSHLLVDMRFGAYKCSELALARELWELLPEKSLAIVDRNFLVVPDLQAFQSAGTERYWITRAKKTTKLKTLRRLGKNDEIVEVELAPDYRRQIAFTGQLIARAIKYQRKGHPPSTLVTSLLDASRYPANELVALYHERWEIELGYDEVKTHLLEREESIRSRTPDGVRQEIWGIGLAYNLVRLEMERAADEAGVAPTRISFVNALALIRFTLMAISTPPLAPGTAPKQLSSMRNQLKLLVLPPRRERGSPREVKIKMSNYTRKKSRRETAK